MPARDGQCMCGAVRFTADDVATEFSACHCRMCQRWTGGPYLSTTAGSVSFASEEHLIRHQSSAWAERGFCAQCGTGLFYRLLSTGDYSMSIGAFDEADDFVLTSEIFTDRKPGGYALAGEHERLTEAETIARFKDSVD